MIKELWQDVNNIDSKKDEVFAIDKVTKAYKFASLRLPSLINESWKSQLQFVPIRIIGNDINNFYGDLYDINPIYSSFSSLIKKDEDNVRANIIGRGDNIFSLANDTDNFFKASPVLWDKFECIALRLIENGNPLH